MDFELTKKQRLARKIAREFAENELAPTAEVRDEKMEFPRDAIKEMAKLGFLGISIPKEYGGCELDSISYVLIIEEIAKACASTAIIVSVHNSVCAYPILVLGTDEQKMKYLPELTSGRMLGAFALTEPNAGSDAASIETTAEFKGDHYLLNGTKNFITNGESSDIVIVMASTDRSKRGKGITSFIIEKGFSGLKVGKKENKIGLRSSDTCGLVFEDCMVPVENVLGTVGEGLQTALSTLTFGRVGVAAQALGVAGCSMKECIKYAKSRKQFGRPIGDFQAIQWMIADMATEIEAARYLIFKAAMLKDQGESFALEGPMAKLYATEVAMRIATKAIQVHGGYGCIKGHRVERCFRDAKILEIYEGTSEIQRLIIARNVIR
ncbi:MAG: acyl-CoA dehydrogenase family protein [Spirochaetota bacterium]|nr:acyl-CoA dehydrogenase family protein [Spirochaetota bacterium]